MSDSDELFEDDSETGIKRLQSAHNSENSYSSLYGNSFFGESNDPEREAHTEMELQRLNQESKPSAIQFKSRRFMFPHQKTEMRIRAKENDKVKKEKFRKVHFKETTVFYCYNAEPTSFNDYYEWIRHCEVYLLTGHFFKHFVKEFIDDVAQTVVSDPEAALEYWKKIMRQGSPELFTLENLDGPLHHVSVLGNDKAGVLPLLPDIREDMLLDPVFNKSKRERKKKKSSLKDKSGFMKGLSKTIEEAEGSSESSEDSVPKNVYLQLHHRQEIPIERRHQIKEKNDMSALKKLEVTYRNDFNSMYGARLMTKDDKEREELDLMMISSLTAELTPGSEDAALFANQTFCKLFVRTITLKNKLFAFSEGKFIRYFRKIFASPTLNPHDKNYNKDSYARGKRNLKSMMKLLDEIAESAQQMEEELKRNAENKERYMGNGTTDLCEWQNFGKIVVHKQGDETCRDFFSGSEFVLTKKEAILESKMKVKRVLIGGRKLKKKKKDALKKILGEEAIPRKGDVVPPPLIHLPHYFLKFHEFLKDPLRYWAFVKLKWTETYIGVINSGITIAILNDNLPLLRWIENLQYPKVIEETSIISSEPWFYTGREQSKESERTSNVYKLTRVQPIGGPPSNIVGSYHHVYNYLLTVKDEKNPLMVKNARIPMRVDSLSVLLNPIIRADMFFSRKRHACDHKCVGHSGMLLATAIRLGCFTVIDHMVSRGLKLNMKLCSGDAKTLRWDLPLDTRIKLLNKKKKSEKGKLKNQMSKSFIMSAKSLIKPSKKRAAKKEDESQQESQAQTTVLADEISLQKGKELTKDQTLQRQKQEQKDKILKLKSVRDLVSEEKTESSSTISQDVTFINDSKKNSLVSTFEKLTPLAIAVSCAVDDIYDKKSSLTSLEFNNLPAHVQTEKQDFVEETIVEIEQRSECVEKFLRAGATVLDSEAAALRACLPVVCSIARAMKRTKLKKQKNNRLRLQQASHMNNMTMTPRDKKNLKKNEKRSKKSKRFSVAEFLPKKTVTSTEALNLKSFEMEAQRKYMQSSKKCNFEKRRRLAAALSGFKTLNRITQQAVVEINGSKKKYRKNKFGGFYASMIIRVILAHEAVKRGEWDAIRFLCPYQVDKVKTMELEEDFPEGDVYENSCKNITQLSGEVLKQTIKLLLKDLKHPLSTTNSRAWNGIFFILREYNLTLSNSTMTYMMSCLALNFTRTIRLKAGDFFAMEKILTLKQVQTFLGVNNYPYYQERVIDTFSFTKPKETGLLMKKLKGFFGRRDFNVDMFRESLFIYTTAENMTAVSDSLLPTFIDRARSKTIRTLIFHCLVKKQNPALFRSLEHICRQTNVEKRVYKGFFQDALACYMKDGRSSRVTSIEADIVLQLLKNKVKPKDVNDCFNFLVRSLTVPLFDLEANYDGTDRCADLSRYFALNELFDFLFYQDNLLEDDAAKELFLAILKTIYGCAKDGAIWLQGVDHFIQKFRSLHDMHYEAKSSESPLAKLMKILSKRMKWDMNYSFEKKMLKMTYIDTQKEYSEIPFDSTNANVLDTANGEYISQIV